MARKWYLIRRKAKQSPFYRDMYDRLQKGKDVKILIVGRNAELGEGKTTLAVHLCRLFDCDWDHTQATVGDLDEFLKMYRDLDKGSAILFDEMEKAIDRRRAMSSDNLDMSKAWSMMRYRQMISIGTLPSPSHMDDRLLELSDARITVTKRSMAYPYYVKVDDFSRRISNVRYRDSDGHKEILRFPNLDLDEDFEKLNEEKEDTTMDWINKKVKEREKSES